MHAPTKAETIMAIVYGVSSANANVLFFVRQRSTPNADPGGDPSPRKDIRKDNEINMQQKWRDGVNAESNFFWNNNASVR